MISKSIENTMIILKFIILQSDLCFFKPVYSLGEDCEVYLLIWVDYGDGLHLSRTGVSDLSERLLDKLNGQPPFQYPQKGPAMWQECRGGRQNFNSLQRTNTNNLVPLTGSYAHQPRPSRVAMRQDTYQQTAQVNQRYLDVTGQVPWTNPPYPVHIMPRYPLIAKM